MSKSEHHIDKLTPELIEKYHGGKLSESEAYQVERLMLNSEFDNEAMEGFENFSGDIESDLYSLNSRLEKRISEEKNDNQFLWIKIAASILILALSSYLIWDLTQSESLQPLNVAEQKKELPEREETASTLEDTTEEKQESEEVPFIAQNKSVTPSEPEVKPKPKTQVEKEIPVKIKESAAGSGTSALNTLAYEPTEKKDDFGAEADEEYLEEVIVEEMSAVETEQLYAKEISPESIQNADVSRRRTAKKSKLEAPSTSVAGEIYSYSNTITGKVISAEDGSPLPGVNVVLKGTTIGTVTDIDGNYRLENVTSDSSNVLLFSFIGLESKELVLGSKPKLNIEMSADTQQLSEVVVTAVGVQREKKSLGYAVSKTDDQNSNDIVVMRSNTDNLEGIYKFAQPVIGINAYKKYLTENINYPDDKEVEAGKVIVTFDVNEDSTLSNYTIKTGLTEWHNNEALRLVKEGPNWNPSTNDGMAELSNVRVVVTFRPK
ncbi:MAG: carboxypeptidase-like regulatory domain-containing protein [Fulvivirga sp.]|uniref:carboxypeptidase-like regulatory domain-containing protein n=1 Tax=Fulvivirga sp. TaxID=1931237 RepID=UPI0032ED1AC0